MKYLWLLYRTGKLKDFNIGEVGAKDFSVIMAEIMNEMFDFAWVVEAPTSQGFRPVVIFFGIDNYRFVLLADALWLPWATKRNKIEAYITALVILRRDLPVYFYLDDDKFALYICRHGVARTVGTLHEIGGSKFYEVRQVLR